MVFSAVFTRHGPSCAVRRWDYPTKYRHGPSVTRPERWRHLHASGDSQLTAGFTFTAKLVPLLTRPCPRRPLSQPRRLSWRATKCALLTRIRRAASDFSKQFLFIGLLDEDGHPAAGRRADGDGGWKHDRLKSIASHATAHPIGSGDAEP